ncbi:hypothetical protein NE237_007498 [Protea cynaroides]|uniref:Major facilitator superfamily (MFS) profile domain-containing protein n=1 Tax=Protea cynaroides TaxID=273540 RepID=A0A9Q0QWK3_9MAGN|nr:hypothetical protein NE237_007498 [Protea cynaroides]
MPEKARYTALVALNMKQAATDMPMVLNVEMEAEPEKVESQSLFQKDMFLDVGWLPSVGTVSAFEEAYMIAKTQTIIAICSTIPSYWFTVTFIDYIAEIFPARLRSTYQGISAACDKAGAIMGAFGLLYATKSPNKNLDDVGYPPGNGVQKAKVLKALDVAKTQFFHFTAIVIAGMGFFTDSYDLFCISLVTTLIGRIYYHIPGTTNSGSLPPDVNAAIIGVALCGMFAGHLFFGFIGDKMGRKRMYGVTLILMVVNPIASGLSFGHTAKGVVGTLCFFRFWLGFGIGGDYPLSATIMSEYANKKTRGAFIAAVFTMQGFGILVGGIVAIIISASFNVAYPVSTYQYNPVGWTVPQADYVWRIILMVGAIPAAFTYYWRMKMPETARYTALVARNAKQAAIDMAMVLNVEMEAEPEKVESLAMEPSSSYGLFSKEFLRRHGLHLLGTTTTWFFIDIAFYSQSLFQKDIFNDVGWLPCSKTMNALEETYMIARAQTIIALCGTIPGYWFTVAFIDHIGRFVIQLMGFFMMTIFMLGLAIPYNNYWNTSNNNAGFIVMYAFTFFFSNFGPNVTTFVVPAEIFPARLRSTCHGISAACGKAGAIIGAFRFLNGSISPNTCNDQGINVQKTLYVLSATNFLGFLFTFLVPEAKGKSLEEMSGEVKPEEKSGTNEEAIQQPQQAK